MNLSFAGCGFLGVYHLGVAACLDRHAPMFLQKITAFAGTSAGSIVAAMLATSTPLSKYSDHVVEMTQEAQRHILGPLNPQFDLVEILRKGLESCLPPDSHKLASGRLFVSLTRLKDRKNVLISEFHSKEDLIQALLASCHIPFYAGLNFPVIKSEKWYDGGFTDNLPIMPFGETIRVSPFSGKVEICPRDKSQPLTEMKWSNMHVYVNRENMQRGRYILYPPREQVLNTVYCNGCTDALRFLKEKNLL